VRTAQEIADPGAHLRRGEAACHAAGNAKGEGRAIHKTPVQSAPKLEGVGILQGRQTLFSTFFLHLSNNFSAVVHRQCLYEGCPNYCERTFDYSATKCPPGPLEGCMKRAEE